LEEERFREHRQGVIFIAEHRRGVPHTYIFESVLGEERFPRDMTRVSQSLEEEKLSRT
jgi:hypothetical protein